MVRAYGTSILLHLVAAVLVCLVTFLPARVRPTDWLEPVFLVSLPPSVPAPVFEAVSPRSFEPPSEEIMEPEAMEPGESLAERLQARLIEVNIPKNLPTAVPRLNRERTTIQKKPIESDRTEKADEKSMVMPEAGFSDVWYLTLLTQRLSERWNPYRDGIGILKREVMVSFTIYDNGRIDNVVLLRPSGDVRFDRSGFTAVSDCGYFPPLPRSWRKESLQVSVRFREK
ncbi:MAG: TonB family protein [Candidatus Omnitrophota bacterium]